ncbi:MAG TPA: peptidoglycan recognition family protein [Verrucomicrobiae bacterium]|jgi:hypothetical protein|nr:peptidoglycan recognition family protein [Verrucomicrobiae bacterium]
MAHYIDEALWDNALKQPDWYIYIQEDFRRLERLAEQTPGQVEHTSIKAEAYDAVEHALRAGTIPLATQGDNLDRERQPIDTIVIHHTKNQPGMRLERLNAMQLLRIYGMYYADPTNPREKRFKGQPVWSNHFYQGKQVFWGYHWLIRHNGMAEQILPDAAIGWHAGNWDINTCSIGICFDDDLTNKEPADSALSSVARLIKQRYPTIKPDNIVGHCSVNDKTVCPGHLFAKTWREKLLQLLQLSA